MNTEKKNYRQPRVIDCNDGNVSIPKQMLIKMYKSLKTEFIGRQQWEERTLKLMTNRVMDTDPRNLDQLNQLQKDLHEHIEETIVFHEIEAFVANELEQQEKEL